MCVADVTVTSERTGTSNVRSRSRAAAAVAGVVGVARIDARAVDAADDDDRDRIR